MIEVKDQMNNVIRLVSKPKRIISLVPSQTELLFDLGLEEEVVGITKFCIYPQEWFKTKKRVGGTKNADLKKIKDLQPDLIIGNKEENEKQNITDIAENFPVWMSDIFNLQDAKMMIQSIGELVEKQEKTKEVLTKIELEFQKLDHFLLNNHYFQGKSVAYFIWREPYILAGKNTFIDYIINYLGFKNYTSTERYPNLEKQVIDPDFIFLSSEPYPFKEKHIQELQGQFPVSKIILVDGEMFSWYGSRLMYAPQYFIEMLKELK